MNNYDTLLGLGLGAAAAWYLWNKLDDWSEPAAPPRSDRKFTEHDLAVYDGRDARLCFVAIDTEVFDVSKDKAQWSGLGGKRHAGLQGLPCKDMEELRKRYFPVGKLIVQRSFTKAQLAAFDGRDGRPVYICAKGVVYEVDPDFYGPEGPYGMMAGKDASRALALVSLDPADVENSDVSDLGWSDLNTLEEWVAKFETKYHRVGTLEGYQAPSKAAGAGALASSKPAGSETFLSKERQQVRLAEKIELSHDTRLFRFALGGEHLRLGLPIGKHIKFWAPNASKRAKEGEWNGRADEEKGAEIERKYTPSSLDDERFGFFDVVIKVYKAGAVERFPDGGKLSQHMESLRVGDTMDLAGPFGLIEYKGQGTFNIKKKDRKVKFVGMLAGGTGITPMLQLIKAVLRDASDETKLSLVFANQTEEDILVRDMLEELAHKHPNRFKLHYTVDRPPPGWKFSSGFITADMIKAHMPPPSADTIVLMCGPPPMVKFACKANLDTLGYDKESQIEF